ncbi:hypothetical protein ADK74_16835 [Streptomyces decoyicus]|nr:hypothetical protein ADK74_16835 [Streptomyces decoyicus]
MPPGGPVRSAAAPSRTDVPGPPPDRGRLAGPVEGIGDFVRQLAHNATHSLDDKAGESPPHPVEMPSVRNWAQQPHGNGPSIDF